MRPTPTETLAGIASILRSTVAPAVTDPHARTQLHQVITVLGQLDVEPPAGAIAAADTRLQALLAQCAGWAEADDDRGTAVAVDHGLTDNRAILERFIGELRAWRDVHGAADSDELLTTIANYLRNPAEEP